MERCLNIERSLCSAGASRDRRHGANAKRILESVLTWRIPYMNRIIQHSFFLALFLIALGLFWPQPAPTQGPPKYPIIESASHKGYTEKIDDKASFDMVPIPGGTYLMGSPDNETGRGDNEGPQHPVTVKPFWMAKCEITWDEYDIYWENRPKGPPQRPEITKKPYKLP